MHIEASAGNLNDRNSARNCLKVYVFLLCQYLTELSKSKTTKDLSKKAKKTNKKDSIPVSEDLSKQLVTEIKDQLILSYECLIRAIDLSIENLWQD